MAELKSKLDEWCEEQGHDRYWWTEETEAEVGRCLHLMTEGKEFDPQTGAEYYFVGCHYANQEKDRMLAAFTQGGERNDANCLNALGIYYYFQEEDTLALEYFHRAVELGYPVGPFWRARCHEIKGEYHQMKKWYQQAIIQGQSTAAWNLAVYYLTIRKYPGKYAHYMSKALFLGELEALEHLYGYFLSASTEEQREQGFLLAACYKHRLKERELDPAPLWKVRIFTPEVIHSLLFLNSAEIATLDPAYSVLKEQNLTILSYVFYGSATYFVKWITKDVYLHVIQRYLAD